VPMFIEIEAASKGSSVIIIGIVCISAINNKVTILPIPVNDYLGGCTDCRTT
jgi:hypothetical protein